MRLIVPFVSSLSVSRSLSPPLPLSLPLLTRNVRAFSRSIHRSAFLLERVMASG